MKKYLLMTLLSISFSTLIISCTSAEEEAELKKMETEAVDLESVLAEEASKESQFSDTISYANFTMIKPSDWKQEPSENELRLLQFGFDGDGGNKVTGFYFGKDSDVRDANVKRWKGEFTKIESSKESKIVNNSIDLIQLSGTFKKKARPMATEFEEAAGYTTLAAIVPSNEGAYYFKLNGPSDIVSKQYDNFIKLLESYKTK